MIIEGILSFFAGSGASLISEWMKARKEKENQKYALEVKKLDIEQDKINHQQEKERMNMSFNHQVKLNEQNFEFKKDINLQDHTFETEKLDIKAIMDARKSQDKPLLSNATFIDKLSKSFRPVASYSFLFSFIAYKISIFMIGKDIVNRIEDPVEAAKALETLNDKIFDGQTMNGFWAIMGFWFTKRAFVIGRSIMSNNKTKIRT